MINLFKRRQALRVRPQRRPTVTVVRDPGVGRSGNWVPAVRSATPPTVPLQSDVGHTIDVQPSSMAKIDFKTSAVDRAQGFLIASVPLYGAFALGVLVVAVALWSVPWLSFTAFLVYWLSFVGAWLAGYVYTLAVSAEGIAFFEAKQKWAILKEEQRRRWDQYERQMIGDDE